MWSGSIVARMDVPDSRYDESPVLLVVEDRAISTFPWIGRLKVLGFEVLTAEKVGDLRTVVDDTRPDLLLMSADLAADLPEVLRSAPLVELGGDFEALVAAIVTTLHCRRLDRGPEEKVRALRLEGIGRLSSKLAHDFNNLLGGVLLQAEHLRRSSLGEELAISVDVMVLAVEHGKVLTGQLADLTKVPTTETCASEVPEEERSTKSVVSEHTSKDVAIRILVVDDHTIMREALSSALSRIGYECLAASSVGEALSLVEAYGASIDLMISDLAMPLMNGAALGQLVRKAYPEIATILMTGSATSSGLGADALLLNKPFDLVELQEAIDAALVPRHSEDD